MDEKKTDLLLQLVRTLWYSWCTALFLMMLYECSIIPYGHFYQTVTAAGYFKWLTFLEAAAVQVMAFMLMAACGLCVMYFVFSFVLFVTGHRLEYEPCKKQIRRPLRTIYAVQAILSTTSAIDLCLYCCDSKILPPAICIPAAMAIVIMEIFLYHAIQTAAAYWHAFRTGRIIS